MEHLKILIRGEYYKVDKHGCIYGGPNKIEPTCKSGHQWDVLGVSKHHMNNRPTILFNEIWEHPEKALKGYLWDIDHGTVRRWGGLYYGQQPRIQACFKVSQ